MVRDRRPLSRLDRHAGATLRAVASRMPGGTAGARLVADAMSPSYRLIVAVLIARRGRRRAGLEALAAGVLAAMSARALRDRIGRPRPGSRRDGSLPSRHAAAAVAITRAIRRHEPRAGGALACATAIGLLGRVAARHHDPADIAAGALLGAGADRAVARLAGRLAGRKGAR